MLRSRSLTMMLCLIAGTSLLADEAQDLPRRGKQTVVPQSKPRALVSAVDAGTVDLDSICTTRLAAGPSGHRDRRVDLSAGHSVVREFSVDSAFAPSDAALAAALAADDALTVGGLRSALAEYAGALPDVCVAAAAAPTPVRAAQVRIFGHIAFIRPGAGPVSLLPRTQVVVIDLRDLPAVDELAQLLIAAVAPAMRTLPRSPKRWARVHEGPVDELVSPFNVYSTGIGTMPSVALAATGDRDLPIVLIVGDRIAPQAANFAAALRSSGRAWIAGGSVPLALAESEWRGVGTHGLAIRTSITIDPTPLHEESVRGTVRQDDPFDPATASVKRDFVVDDGTQALELAVTGQANADIDLYLLHDTDGNGNFSFPDELVAVSATETSQEQILLGGAALAPGRYQAWLHGYAVPDNGATTALDVFQGAAVPDTIPADAPLPGDEVIPIAVIARAISQTPPRVSGSATRTFPLVVNPFGFRHPTGQTRGELRAGLIAAHAVVRLFYRYFPIVGDTIDLRLVETLEAVDRHDPADRIAAWRILRRFGEALHDGHQFVSSFEPLYPTFLPVFLEHVGGRPIVRRSNAVGVLPGDAIVALNGRPIEEVYAEELARTSAATEGYKRDIADRYIYGMNGPLALMLEDPTGSRRVVTVAPQPIEDYFDVATRAVSDRMAGPLSEFGAPDIYYLNMNFFVLFARSQMLAAIAEATARGSNGLVLDMRDYPGVSNYEVASRLIQEPFLSPMFLVNRLTSTGAPSTEFSQRQVFPIGNPSFAGPIVLLTSPHAVSAAENFMQMLVGADRLRAIVGRQSAGTNGNISAISLPGGFEFSFTGMEVRNPDGSRFHGVGIMPDVEVAITALDLQNGVDRDLLVAIGLFNK